ncbi:metal-dependent hydrolase [Mycobacteroides abscessus]|uniref:metal-dependent hydrolase n=1 Tax=Mycobacteroides abscessus TaxID=36809 RepID=UPI000D3E8CC6|nr:metal-dependent hydrolase [Mycobacteroides abscessus]PVB25946.1 metal-dependent hydrolase [Mycobacteroides abscessus]
MKLFNNTRFPMDTVDIGPLQLKARNVAFDLGQTPLHWIPGHPVASHAVSAYHLLFPEVERFFITAFREALPEIADARLREDVLGFIGQETMHANAHDESLGDFFQRNGIDPTPLLEQARYMLSKVMGPKQFANAKQSRQHLITRLAITAAFENFTAFLGHFVLNCSWDQHHADPNMTEIFRWHGAEEMEHRTVAWDVAMYFDPRYWRRVTTMVVVFPLVVWISSRFIWYLIKNDPNAPRSRIRAIYELVRDGRRRLLPTLTMVLGSAFDYLKPNFRPDETGSMAQALSYLATIEARPEAA